MSVPLPPCPQPFEDHTYATKHGVALELRFWPVPASSSASRPPFVLYIHGGAFAAGKHHYPNPWVVPGFRSRGIAVVSAAYRFAPAASLADMLADAADAWAYARARLPVDPARGILVGESAGGTIVTNLAHDLVPPPRAVVDVYGVTDFTGARWQRGAPRGPADIQPLSGQFSEADVRAAIEHPDISKALTLCPFEFETPESEIAERWALPGYRYTDAQRFQYDLKRYMRTHNTLVEVILRRAPGEDDASFLKKCAAFSSLKRLDGAKSYPPTFFLHGEADPVVPIDNARRMAARLREMGVDIGEAYEPDMVHEFDHKYHGPHTPGWDTYIEPVLDFVVKHA